MLKHPDPLLFSGSDKALPRNCSIHGVLTTVLSASTMLGQYWSNIDEYLMLTRGGYASMGLKVKYFCTGMRRYYLIVGSEQLNYLRLEKFIPV